MESFSTSSARRALGSLQAVRWTGDSAGFSNVRMMYAGRTGVCGNGLCEVCPVRHIYTFVMPAVVSVMILTNINV